MSEVQVPPMDIADAARVAVVDVAAGTTKIIGGEVDPVSGVGMAILEDKNKNPVLRVFKSVLAGVVYLGRLGRKS